MISDLMIINACHKNAGPEFKNPKENLQTDLRLTLDDVLSRYEQAEEAKAKEDAESNKENAKPPQLPASFPQLAQMDTAVAALNRWRPETHTFHFRWGEMTVTLQDVSFLTGLPLRGEPLVPGPPPADWKARLEHRFGAPVPERADGQHQRLAVAHRTDLAGLTFHPPTPSLDRKSVV